MVKYEGIGIILNDKVIVGSLTLLEYVVLFNDSRSGQTIESSKMHALCHLLDKALKSGIVSEAAVLSIGPLASMIGIKVVVMNTDETFIHVLRKALELALLVNPSELNLSLENCGCWHNVDCSGAQKIVKDFLKYTEEHNA